MGEGSDELHGSLERLAALNREQGISESDPFTLERYRQFGRLLPTGTETVLDVGCNTGRGGAALKRVAPNIKLYGIDMLEDRVAQIPDNLYENVYVGMFDVGYAAPSTGFDAVLMAELIEHVPWDAFDALLSDVHRVLRPGGLLLLTTPNPHYLLLKWVSNNSVLGGPHVSLHCPRALAQYLVYREFSVQHLKGTGRVSQKLGRHLPLPFYGSYMLIASRTDDVL